MEIAVTVNAGDWFSADYFVARERFREAAEKLGWAAESHQVASREELTLDVARAPGIDGASTLVVSSGLHGVEGFFGSAVQLALLDRWRKNGVPALNCVFMHGLNPYGFAEDRRCDERNVDLNRNFLLPGESFEGSPAGYGQLDALLNPKHAPARWEPFAFKALLAIARNGGLAKVKQTIAAGQYDFPRGLFYGGQEPSRLQTILAGNLGRWLGASPRVVHLDLHTGLGKSGTCKMLIDYQLTPAQRSWLERCFGTRGMEENGSGGTAYQTRGSIGRWLTEFSRGRDYLYACAEFGTLGPIRMLAKLRAENQAHHWGGIDSDATRRARRNLREAFCPASPRWRESVIRESFRVTDMAIAGLQTKLAAKCGTP